MRENNHSEQRKRRTPPRDRLGFEEDNSPQPSPFHPNLSIPGLLSSLPRSGSVDRDYVGIDSAFHGAQPSPCSHDFNEWDCR